MTKDDKDLVIRDLSARIPYDTWVQIEMCVEHFNGGNYFRTTKKQDVLLDGNIVDALINDPAVKDVKAYIRPISDMSDEEKKELLSIFNNSLFTFTVNTFGDVESLQELKEEDIIYYDVGTMSEWIDWLLKNHFDFRSREGKTMIERGCALAAKEGMYGEG